VEKLHADVNHDVLEIDLGPGAFIEILLWEHGHQGGIYGIDLSDVMYRQASRHNRQGDEAGRPVLPVTAA